jgi:hypothetical protein
MRPLLLLALTACGGATADAPAAKAPHEIAPSVATPPPVATPQPTIAFRGADAADGRWKLVGLPAVARGGELVVLPMISGDGGRGFPNLQLEVRDRSDHVVQHIPVLATDEWEKLQGKNGAAGPELERRIDAANVELAKLHAVHDLVAMHALEVQVPEGQAHHEAHLAIGDGFDVDFNGDHLHVFRHNASRSFLTLDARSWLAPPQRHGPTETCTNPAFLDNTYHATNINLLVVEIGYTGTDTCWEPAHQMHVVAW